MQNFRKFLFSILLFVIQCLAFISLHENKEWTFLYFFGMQMSACI